MMRDVQRWIRRVATPGLIATCAIALTACDAGPATNPSSSKERPVAESLAVTQCALLAARVDAIAGSGPLLLRSYDEPVAGGIDNDDALRTAAFSYDNALAVIALNACAKPLQARRIGEALRIASMTGRLRNTYREGPIETVPLPNGWWSEADSRWVEDSYQVGTATGNVAWVALAMLTLAAEDKSPQWREAALRLATWTVDHARDASTSGGFSGGVHGFDGAEVKLEWKATEHNTDLVAVFALLAAQDDAAKWSQYRDEAFAFVAAQWDANAGRFLIGTLPNGRPNLDASGLDAQLWPLLLPNALPDWKREMTFVERSYGVGEGFDFNADRDGIWTEGTAQAALVYAALGDQAKAERSLREVALRSPTKSPATYLLATDRSRISTGLAVGPDSDAADFFYYQRPHLAASAWAVIAATSWNPFTAASVEPVRSAADDQKSATDD